MTWNTIILVNLWCLWVWNSGTALSFLLSFKIFFQDFVCLFIWWGERERPWAGPEHRVWHGVRSHDLEIMIWAETKCQMLKWLTRPDAPGRAHFLFHVCGVSEGKMNSDRWLESSRGFHSHICCLDWDVLKAGPNWNCCLKHLNMTLCVAWVSLPRGC